MDITNCLRPTVDNAVILLMRGGKHRESNSMVRFQTGLSFKEWKER